MAVLTSQQQNEVKDFQEKISNEYSVYNQAIQKQLDSFQQEKQDNFKQQGVIIKRLEAIIAEQYNSFIEQFDKTHLEHQKFVNTLKDNI